VGIVEIQEKVGWWSYGSSRDKQRFCSDKKEPKSLQLATCFPRAQNILHKSRGFAPDHAGEAYSAPPDLLGLLAEFAGSHDRESRVETRHTHITAAKDSLPTGQPVAGFAIGD